MIVKKFAAVIAGVAMLVMGAGNAFAASNTAYVDGMTVTYTLNCSTSTAIASTKAVPANSGYLYVGVNAYSYDNLNKQLVTRGSSVSYSGSMEVSTKVVSSAYGFPFVSAQSTHSVNSWSGFLSK